ncbi:MAG: Flp pilus assembly complex ATPase component TadA [Chloroflexi bacterium]|nr:Flp pilus assembly complex ATPase component TadA [Chloroflexota bacterium]
MSDEKRDWSKGVRLVPSRQGTRMVSIRALVERVVDQFMREFGDDHPDVVAAKTRTERLKLLRDTVLYVTAIESADLDQAELAALTDEAYSELFGYGGLDRYLADPAVSTVTFEGIEKTAARSGLGELEPAGRAFEDFASLQRVLVRMLADADTELGHSPYYEVGLTAFGRRMCLNLVMPPAASLPEGYIRLHPAEPIPLNAFADGETTLAVLRAIARSSHGVLVVGEADSGKTTLAGALAREADARSVRSIERAGELALAGGAERFVVQWPKDDRPPVSFAETAAAAAELPCELLVVDEIRADEPAAVLPLLNAAGVNRQIWTFRGTAEAKRLAPALSMLTLRAMQAAGSADGPAKSVFETLPFVITLRRRKGRLAIVGISEWQADEARAPSMVELLGQGWNGLEPTGKVPQRALDVDPTRWAKPSE